MEEKSLETNKGTLHVVFFPNPGESEKVEIDEDFTVRGKITFTLPGTAPTICSG